MPPRYAYWTILIDSRPTAFRAREREELVPTLNQLKRKSADVVMKWFARGRLWESPEAEIAAGQAPKPPRENRGGDWRPGGTHKDPRDRFKKRNRDKTAEARVSDEANAPPDPETETRRRDKPAGGAPRGD